MYKLIFDLLTEPLGLPVSVLWEYVILFLLNEIAYGIAWIASPGGKWGSEIHWAVRIPTFLAIWWTTYAFINIAKWFWINRILLLNILSGVTVFAIITGIFYFCKNKKKGYLQR